MAAEKLLALAVKVNGTPGGSWVLLERDGKLYAPVSAFKQWRLLETHAGASIEHRGRTWRELTPIPGYKAEFNLAEQAVALSFAPSELAPLTLGQPYRRAPLGPVLPAVFLNYDLSYQHVERRGVGRRRDLGALTELGFSGSAGVFTSTAVAREVPTPTATEGEAARRRSSYPWSYPLDWTRLETAFRTDDEERNLTLIAGDSATRAGMWGRSVYFGGIQLGRNFALSPGLATYPRPLIAGQSAAPSTLELYVDDVLRETQRVPAGPFSIDSLPMLTGSGQVRVVVRDQLGRETMISEDFHATPNLLEPGLSDFAVQAGRVRLNLGRESSDYGAAFGSGLYRYGLAPAATLELRGEASRQTSGAGAGVAIALPWQMVAQAGLAASRNDIAGSGRRAVLDLQRPTIRHSFGMRYEESSPAWREVGALPAIHKSIASARYSTRGGPWYFGLAAVQTTLGTGERLRTASANATLQLPGSAALTFTATRISGLTSADALSVSLSIPLGGGVMAIGQVGAREGGTDARATVTRNPGVGLGLGAHGTIGKLQGRDYAEGGAFYQGEHATFSGEVHTEEAFQGARLGLQGALVASDGTLFATRALRSSWAIVEVPGQEDVGVQVHSAVRARTGADGKTLVMGLAPYLPNRLRLDPNDLPIGAELDTIEGEVVPRARRGVKLAFQIRPGRAALLVLSLPDGAPAPHGALLSVGEERFYVGAHGRAFVTGIEPGAIARLAWEGGSCEIPLELPAGEEEVPTLRLRCR